MKQEKEEKAGHSPNTNGHRLSHIAYSADPRQAAHYKIALISCSQDPPVTCHHINFRSVNRTSLQNVTQSLPQRCRIRSSPIERTHLF